MPVRLRPPWVKISQRGRRFAFGGHALGVDGDDDALVAELPGRARDKAAVRDRGGVDGDLVGARLQKRAHVVQRPHPAAYG